MGIVSGLIQKGDQWDGSLRHTPLATSALAQLGIERMLGQKLCDLRLYGCEGGLVL